MPGLEGRVVLITGASSGIGAAAASAFAAEGSRLVLAARRIERIEAAIPALREAGAPEVRALALDVRDFEDVRETLEGLPAPLKEVEVLLNNAGLSRGLERLHEGSLEDWNEMIDTNVKGLLHVDRVVVPWMVARGRGTVVHLGSIAGREVYPGGNVYCATKHAVRAATEGLRLDLLGTGVRVATVDPGLVETEFSVVRFRGNETKARAVYRGLTPLTAGDVAEAIVWIAARPAHVQVAEIVLFPTDQASATRVHRREETR